MTTPVAPTGDGRAREVIDRASSAGRGGNLDAPVVNRRRPLKAYVLLIVFLAVVVAAAGAVFVRRASLNASRSSARTDADYGAGLAARAINAEVEMFQKSAAATAANPGIAQVFSNPQACTLSFGGGNAFTSGHIDVLDLAGAVRCSSLRSTDPAGYEQAPWLYRALSGPVLEGPVSDPRTGRSALVAASPVPGRGIVAIFADIDTLGPALTEEFGGPDHLEFLVTSADRKTIVTRSVNGSRWVGRPTAGTAFAPEHPGVPTQDVDGHSRLYGHVDIERPGWRIWAGADTARAVAGARRLAQQEGGIVLVGAVLLMGASILVYHRIAGPLRRLSTAVRAEADRSTPDAVAVAGPAEVALIAENFNRLAATVGQSLDAGLRLTAIVNAAQDAIIGETLDGTITSWNSGAESTYGYAAEEILGRNESILMPPDRAHELTEFLNRVAAGQRVDRIETQRVRKDGSIIDVAVTVSPVRDASGVVTGAAVVSRDVTSAIAAINDLRSSEARKGAILQSALDCIITMDGNGRIVEFNPAAERTFGYSVEQAVGRPLAELIIPADLREAHTAGLAKYLATGEGPILGQRMELTAQRADGSRFPAEVAITRVDLDGPPMFTGYLRDLTDQKRAEAARDALERRLEQSQRLESLGQLAGGVAHDFNNLLAVIMNYADFVAEDTVEHPTVHADALEIRSAAERAARLTRQLLIFGRRETTEPQLLDIRAVIADLRNLLSRSIGEHVKLVVPPGSPLPLPPVLADRGQLEQVLVNLAVNARDAMPRGGTLTIETDAVMLDEDHALIRPSVQPGWYVQLAVSDNGVGMSPEVAARVFEPFFTTKPKGQGTGLGLATVYGIISAAGGAISVYSEEGIGTTIRVYLPAAAGTPTQQLSPTSEDRIKGRGETILVVEDEAPMREVTTRILRRNGYHVADAASGAEALALADTHPCQLLLTDVVMPGMSGRDVADAIRRRHPRIPVLYMSGYSEGVLGPQRGLEVSVPLIQKPFNEQTLLTKVRAALDSVISVASQSGGIT